MYRDFFTASMPRYFLIACFDPNGGEVMRKRIDAEETQKLSLAEAAQYLLDECRMVLPGIQALFGFQLIAVFSPGFAQQLTHDKQCLHLLAITLVALAVAMVMTPAAYHRQDPREIS